MNTLPIHRIDLWYVPVRPVPADCFTDCWGLLSAVEKDRYNAFHFDKDRLRYLLTRVLVRQLSASYLSTSAQELVFGYNAFERPFLLPGQNPLGLDFNVSHTDQGIVCAFARRARIGVDLESYVRQRSPEIVEDFFTEQEKGQLHAAPKNQRNRRFIELWTLKEAYIKALGKGTAIPLDSFFFNLQPGHIEFVDLENGEDNAGWHFWMLEAPDEQVLSLGVCFEDFSPLPPQFCIHPFNPYSEHSSDTESPLQVYSTNETQKCTNI